MPTATHSRLDGLIAVSGDSQVKTLGSIVWFSVPDQNVPLRRLRKLWQLAGLDPAPLPKDTKAVNVFKRSVRDQAGTHTDPETGLQTETDVRLVLENGEDVIYQISRVVRDIDKRLVEYPKALKVWFSKVTSDIDFQALGEVPRADVLPIMETIMADFDANAKTVTGPKVRTLVRSYVKEDADEQGGVTGLSGENMRGKAGGVYFVLAQYNQQLDSLAEFLDELYAPHGRAYLYKVPLADGASERELIRRHHTQNCVAEMESAMADARELLREGRERGIRSNVAEHHWRKLASLRRRAGQYNQALRSEQEEVSAHLDLLNRQLKKLV